MGRIILSDMWTLGRQSIAGVLITFFGLVSVYVTAEPVVTRAVTDQFIINQTVTSEIAFVATASNITMDTSIPGITGGTASGSTQVRVYTNDAAGYNMTIAASGSPAMQGVAQGGSIPDFSTTTTGYMSEPSFGFIVPTNRAGFGYTVSASTTADLDQSFLDDGALCNTGALDTAEGLDCWIGASTTAFRIVNRTSETTASGATTTLYFRTTIMPSPTPAVPEDLYQATTTLTAVTN